MAFFSSPGPKGQRPSRRAAAPKRAARPLESDKRRNEQDLRELQKKEAELRRLHEEKMRELEDLPRKIAEKERIEREKMRVRALSTATDDVFGTRRGAGRHAVPLRAVAGRLTKSEQRNARLQFILLCAVFAALLLALWKSIP
jgi:hypothetical protein